MTLVFKIIILFCIYFFKRFYLFERERERARAQVMGGTEGEGEADCPMSEEPDTRAVSPSQMLGTEPAGRPGPVFVLLSGHVCGDLKKISSSVAKETPLPLPCLWKGWSEGLFFIRNS